MEINDLAVHLHEAGREAVESSNTVIPDLLAHIEHQRRALEWMARRSLSYNGESAENFQSICNLALLATKDEQFVRSVDKIRKNAARQWAGPIPMPEESTL